MNYFNFKRYKFSTITKSFSNAIYKALKFFKFKDFKIYTYRNYIKSKVIHFDKNATHIHVSLKLSLLCICVLFVFTHRFIFGNNPSNILSLFYFCHEEKLFPEIKLLKYQLLLLPMKIQTNA